MTGRVLPGATGHLTWGVPGECDDVTGAWHAGCVRGAGQGDGVLAAVPGRDLACDSNPRTQVFSALGQPVLVHGARPARHQVHSSGPWDDPSREWSVMPVSSRGPRRRRSWWRHTPLIDSGDPNPCKAGGVQTRPGRAHLLAMLQERHRLAGAFAAHPAPYCATGTAPEPRPKGASITSTTTRP